MVLAILGCATCVLLPAGATAHGVVGKRFFPSTLSIEDPFVSDELSLPSSSFLEEPGDAETPDTRVLEISGEYSKRITDRFGVSIAGEFRHLDLEGSGSESGFGNLELGAKLQLLTVAPHELVVSIGLDAEVGDTGDPEVEADAFSVISPSLSFGKGMGDLPDFLRYLRPLAFTGILGAGLPTDRTTVRTSVDPHTGSLEREVERNPTTLDWGFSLQYNLQYLQSYVHDFGLGAPLDRWIAVIELDPQTCLDRGCGGQTTGTVSPGVIWFGKSIQLGLEAQIPISDRTGGHVGVRALVHLFIDDLLPKTLGRPLWRASR
ncbi:MAG: hypothetical protein ACE5IL_11990 [Myxococcota bacterium]